MTLGTQPRPGIRSANVTATLGGTEDPDLVYVVSSHFDSVERGPGADDNTSGTSVLLETARMFRNIPCRRQSTLRSLLEKRQGCWAAESSSGGRFGMAYTSPGRLTTTCWGGPTTTDSTTPFGIPNSGIRDVQHAAAFLFSDLVTYDAKYYKSTDAHAYYEEYEDIVGGIGSYPVLGNPHYHQATDELPTINEDLIRETTKANVASIALLAASPSRLTGLAVERERGREGAWVRWNPSVESTVELYTVAYGPGDDPTRYVVRIHKPEIMINLPDRPLVMAVRAVNQRGLASWDWARATVPAR